MAERFKRGDHVEWKFRGRTVTGKVRRRLTARTEVAARPSPRLRRTRTWCAAQVRQGDDAAPGGPRRAPADSTCLD